MLVEGPGRSLLQRTRVKGHEFLPSLGSQHAACRQAFGLAGRQVRSVAPKRRLPQFVPPQLSQPVEKPPSGPQWLHEIKLDGFRMAARIDNGRVQLLTPDRPRLDRKISEARSQRLRTCERGALALIRL